MVKIDNYSETLAGAVELVIAHAESYRVILAPGEDIQDCGREPISYNQNRRFDFPVASYKGKPTKKYFHAVIARLDCGRYEVLAYVL